MLDRSPDGDSDSDEPAEPTNGDEEDSEDYCKGGWFSFLYCNPQPELTCYRLSSSICWRAVQERKIHSNSKTRLGALFHRMAVKRQ
jgi:hypothetical protein